MTSETTNEILIDQESSREPSQGEGAEARRGVKVTDKRMFRPDGELREEYSFLGKETKPAPASPEKPSAQEPARPATVAPEPAAAPAGRSPSAEAPREVAGYADSGPGGRASFVDLMSILAEPVAIYLGDVKLRDGRTAENPEMARLHIDLLEVLQEKTRGNLSAEEHALLDDLLYRSRMRYVQKTGG